MRKLSVFIEINGCKNPVGNICGNSSEDARFLYSQDYLSNDEATAISLSLPLQEEPFSPKQTKAFFEGLLPEGYTRRSVAEWMHVDEGDYISILSGLGKECIGAIQVTEADADAKLQAYRKLSLKEIKELASEGATESAQMIAESHLSLAGASGKVGLYRDEKGKWYLPQGDAPSTHIVKQSHVRLDGIVLNEQIVMHAASMLSIPVPETFVINTDEGRDRDILLASKRFDRSIMSERIVDGLNCPYRQHQEDMAQALGISSSDKYEREGESHLKSVADLIRYNSARPIDDLLMLWDMTAFNWLIGNTDNHIKNLSVLYSPDLKSLRLAPAYDMICTRIYRGSTRDMAFHIGGKYRLEEIGIPEWKKAAEEIGIEPSVAIDRIEDMQGQLPNAIKEAADALCDKFRDHHETQNRIRQLADRILKSGYSM